MATSPLAGKPADPALLVNVPRLVTAYYTGQPDPAVPAQRVSFGTSGHRGSSFDVAFNEAHILATTEAICRHRAKEGTDGPLFIGIDTHALSEPAFASALEVLAAHEVEVMVDRTAGYTPTPVISHAILTYNRGRTTGRADGIVITPSHNPPTDGGFKYNPPEAGPADTSVTGWIQEQANALAGGGPARRAAHPVRSARARRRPRTRTTISRPTSAPSAPWWTSTPSAARASAWAWIRSAAPAWLTGTRSPSATGCGSRW